MTPFKKSLLTLAYLTATAPAHAAAPSADAERYTQMCRRHAHDRNTWPQGTLLWGTRKSTGDENSSVLVSVGLTNVRRDDVGVKALRLEGGHLAPAAREKSGELAGTVLQGTASDGRPVEVAICGAEPSREDPEQVWYRIETWNTVTQSWENPCVESGRAPDPRALAVAGVWDARGAHHDTAARFTFACENGAITKCIRWGYKPWASRKGQSLAEIHQACTRMARADYCGDGHSHTHDNTIIDMYDRLNLLAPSTEASADWDPAMASFEAAWAPDGASCLARTRDGRPLETVLKECPGRFRTGAPVELGDGDRCTVTRVNAQPGTPLLRNRSYDASKGNSG